MAKQIAEVILVSSGLNWGVWTSPDNAEKIRQFPGVLKLVADKDNRYSLHVDPRFDLGELAEEILALNPRKPRKKHWWER